jgi:hypothetical protein
MQSDLHKVAISSVGGGEMKYYLCPWIGTLVVASINGFWLLRAVLI